MKYNFTFLKIVRTLLLALCCMIGTEQAMAQYTASLVQKGAWYTALSKDNNGNLLVARYNGSSYELVKWQGGSPAIPTVLANGLADDGTSDYPWGIAVNPVNNDVFYINPDGGGQIMKIPGGGGLPVTVQSGKVYSTICFDNSNNLLALEWNSSGGGVNGTYRVRRYSSDGSTDLGNVYDGLLAPGDGTYPYAMDVDAAGNIYITNFYSNSDQVGEPGLIRLTAPGYTPATIQAGRHFTGLYFDANNNLYTIEQASTGSSTYQVKKYTDPAGAGTIVYTPLASVFGFYAWGITEINGILYVNDGAASTAIDGTSTTGQVLKLTPPAITVAGVSRVGTTPTNAASVQFTVTFSGTAANVTTDAFTATGVTGASVTNVTSVNNTTYTVTVNTGTGNGTLGLTVTGTNMGNAVTNAPFSGGETYLVDKTAPTGSIAISNGATYATATGVTLNLTSNDLGGSGGIEMAFSEDGSSYSAYEAFAATKSFTLSGADGTKTVYMRLRDGAGNVTTLQDDIILDRAAPVVSSVAVPANGTYGATQQLNFTVVYSENVTVTGTPSIPVTIGGTIVNATYVAAVSTPTNLIFRYTVQAGDLDNNGIAVGSPIALNGGTIADGAGNTANLTLNSIGNASAVLVDAIGPVVTSVSVPAAGTYIINGVLNFTVNFDENVTVTGTPSMPVTIGTTTVQANLVSGSGSNALVFRYTVQPGDDDADGIVVGSPINLNGGTLKDAATNNATLTLNNIDNTSTVFVNTKQPIPTISTTTPSPVTGAFTITITFDEDISDNLTVTDLNVIGVTVSNAARVDARTFTVQLTPPAGQQSGSSAVTVAANVVHNMAGNPNLASNTLNFSWDTKAPAITLTPPADQYYKAGDVLSFTISYDEDVVVTGAPTLPVIIDGTTRQATYIAGADARTLIFSYTVAAGEQDLDGIDLGTNIALNGGSIKDAAGNDAATGVANHYNNILVDGRAPTVVSVSMPGAAGPLTNGYYVAGSTLVFTVTTSETVTVSGNPTLDVIIGSTTRQATFVNNVGNQLTFSYDIVDGDNDDNGITIGTAILLPVGSYIRDAAGNNITPALNGVGDGSGVRINTVHPDVTITPPQTSTVVAPFMITVTFSEQTTDALALADFILTGCTISSLSTTDNISWTGLITPTPNAQGAGTIQLPADVVHNIATNGNKASAVYNFNYDTKSPAITSITAPADATYKAGQVLTFVINYDDNIAVGGAPTLPIIIGSNTRNAALTASTATTLTFRYTLVDGDVDADGIALGATIALNGGAIKDPVGHDAALGVANSYPGILVDATRPTVTSVDVPANGYYKAGQVLSFTVHTSENVTVTGTPSIDVVIGANTRKATFTGGSGTSALAFAYTVVAGDNDMDGIAVGVLNPEGGTLQDAIGNDMVLTLNSVAPTNNVFVNTVIPTVTLSTPTVLNAQWTMTITFSEAVTGFTMGDISTTNANLSGLSTADNITYTVNVAPPAAGVVSLSLPANVAFNIGNNGNAASNTITYTYDATAPAITSVTVPANGTYTNSDALDFTVNFSENVTVTGTPSFPVTVGATVVQATYNAGSGTNALIFRYSIQNGDYDADGITVGAAIALNSGTIQDLAANNAALALNSVGNTSAVLVDAVPPAITSVNVPANGYYKAGDVLSFTVDFNEHVTVTGTPSVPVTIGATTVQANYISGSGTSALVFSYTVVPGNNDMDGIAVGGALALNGGTVKDGLGNDAALTLNSVGNTDNVFVNTVIPTVTLSGPPVLNSPWTMTITFSEIVTGFTLGDITAVNATLSNLQQINSAVYTVLVTAAADGTVELRVPANVANNIGGNGNAASNTITYTHDGTAPAVVSVNLPANGTYNAGDALNFTLNFNENVTVTGTPVLPVQIGTTVVQATYTGGTGTSALAFSYTVLNGQEDNDGISVGAPIDFNGGTIKDAAGNNALTGLAGVGSTTGILVDALAPVITSVTVPANGYYKAGDELNFTVQFSEPIVAAGSTATLPVTIGATTVQATIFSAPTPNSIVFRYVVQTGQVDMDGIAIGAAIVPGGLTLRDVAGNNASLTLNNVGSTSNVFVLANRPTVDVSGAVNVTQPWTAQITFSHAVTGFTLADITLTNATASNLQTTDNITYTALISPVVEGGVSIEVPANIAQDVAGNPNLPSNRLSYYYDPNPPVITSVEVPANGYYKQGDVLNFAVNWNEAVRNNVSPSSLTLPVIIGGATVQAAYTGGYTTQRITFAYTVQAGQMDLDGIQLGTALLLTNASERFTDLSGNVANLTLNNVANTSGVFVHTARPSVTLTTAAAARVNAPFTVTLTFSEAVTQLALADFTLTNATVSNLQTTDNITYSVLVTPTADGAATISLPADVAINVVGNGNTASNSISRTYDATPPAIAAGQSFTVSQYSAAGTVVGTVTATDASGTMQNWAIATDGSGGALQISTAGVISVRNTTLLNALAGTNVTLGVTVSDGLNTSTAVPVTVRVVFVNQPPTLDVINNVTICADVQTHTIQLSGASATEPGQTYTITARSDRDIFDVLSVGAGDVLSYRLKANAPAGRATVTVTIRDNGGTTGGAVDSLRRSFTITVNALPVISITSDKGATVSKGDLVKLTATGGSTYVWTAADGIVGGQRTPVLEVRPQANTTYEVTAASAAGCTATASFALSIVVDFKVDATNILTPNGDGRNDRWVIRNLDSYTDNEVKIFDRAGRMIYSRRNYSNDWDGTVNGSPLAEGTYYYILTIQNGAKTATGYITIVRDRY
jgi:gliding motility-associated-like protein